MYSRFLRSISGARWRPLRRFKKNDDGSTLIELAVFIPVLTVVFAGVVNFSLYIFKAVQVQEAAAAGAAYGINPGKASDTAGMQAAAKSASPSISNLNVTAATIYTCSAGGSIVSSSTICSNNKTPLKYVQVKTTASAGPTMNFLKLSPTLQLNGSATMRVPWTQ